MGDSQKKCIFFQKNNLTFLKTYSIVLALFTFCLALSSAESSGKATARVRLADPETAGKLDSLRKEQVENREKLAKLESENVQLRAENVQLKSEKIQLKNEQIRLGDELKLAIGENSVLRKELLETLSKYSAQTERMKRLDMSAAGIIETLGPLYVGDRESDLTESLDQVMKSGLQLLSRSNALREILQGRISSLNLDSVESAKLRVALNDLETASGNFAKLSVPPVEPSGFETCRILELNDTLNVAILSAGYRNGVRVGMTLKTGENDEILLRVVALRPFVSAALFEKGFIKKLSPGMEARAAGTK